MPSCRMIGFLTELNMYTQHPEAALTVATFSELTTVFKASDHLLGPEHEVPQNLRQVLMTSRVQGSGDIEPHTIYGEAAELVVNAVRTMAADRAHSHSLDAQEFLSERALPLRDASRTRRLGQRLCFWSDSHPETK